MNNKIHIFASDYIFHWPYKINKKSRARFYCGFLTIDAFLIQKEIHANASYHFLTANSLFTKKVKVPNIRYFSIILININIWVIQTTISRANGIIFNFHVQLGGGDKHFPPQRGVGHIFRFWLGRTGEYIIFRLLRPPHFYWMVPNIHWPINYN